MSKTKSNNTFGNYDISKVQPHAKDFEEAVLGAILVRQDVFDRIYGVLKPEHFYIEAHTHIYDAIFSLFTRKAPIDTVTVTEELRIYETLEICGGPHYITDLSNKSTGSSKIEYYIQVILQKYLKRQLILIASQVGQKSFDESSNPFDLINEVHTLLSSLRDNSTTSTTKSIGQIVEEQLQRIEDERRGERESNIVNFEIADLDRATHGAAGGDLIVIAARPGMGKSALAMSMAKSQAKKGIPVALFSLEMKDRKLLERIFAQETNITPKQQMKPKELSQEDMDKLRNTNIGKLPLYLNDTGGINIAQLEAECRNLVKKHGVRKIYVDYLQLVKGVDKKVRDKTQEVSEISNKLKALAMELDIPIIALAQLSRAVDETKDKRPQLSHLRQSGEIEQDADIIIFVLRPEYYDMKDPKTKQPMDVGKAILIVAKNRQGQRRDVKCGFNGPKIEFYDLEDDSYDYNNYSYGDSTDNTEDLFSTVGKEDDDLPF